MSIPEHRPPRTRAAAAASPGGLLLAAASPTRLLPPRGPAGEREEKAARTAAAAAAPLSPGGRRKRARAALLPRLLYAALGGLVLLRAPLPLPLPLPAPAPRAPWSAGGAGSGGDGGGGRNYVAIACTLSAYARKEDYDYLVAVTAANWHSFGFTPIVIAVADSRQRIDQVKRAWDLLLPAEAIVIPVVVPREASVSVAQMSRLYAATVALRRGYLRPGDYVRVTDADMMILRPGPFLPVPGADVDVYDGRCCLGRASRIADGRTCRQYPMHSVGMSAGTWSRLFPVNGTAAGEDERGADGADVDVGRFVLALAKHHFGYDPSAAPGDGGGSVRHGQRRLWFMDQLLLGCTIDGAIERGYNVTLSPTCGKRFALMIGPIQDGLDVHLPRFSLDLEEHRAWMGRLVNETAVLADRYKDRLARYTEGWLRLRSGGAAAGSLSPREFPIVPSKLGEVDR